MMHEKKGWRALLTAVYTHVEHFELGTFLDCDRLGVDKQTDRRLKRHP